MLVQDLTIFDELTLAWKDRDELVTQLGSCPEIHEHPLQHIRHFRTIACELAFRTGRNLLICAFDSLGYTQFERAFGAVARRIKPATSTVPSTSMTAWTSVFRGSLPAQHGIYGTAFYCPELGQTISFLSHKEDVAPALGSSPVWLSAQAGPTLFSELSAAGYSSTFYGLGEELTSLAFFQQIAQGASLLSMPDADRLEYDLQAYAGYLLECAEGTVYTAAPTCSVLFFSLARYVSDNGYTQKALDVLGYYATRIGDFQTRHPNVSVLAVADHGMVEQQPRLTQALIHDADVLRLSESRPGGAGRILFFYPKEYCYAEMWQLIEARIGSSGRLYTRNEYINEVYGTQVYQAQRIGGIVAVAKDKHFPSAGIGDAYEHGALTEEEMISFVGLV